MNAAALIWLGIAAVPTASLAAHPDAPDVRHEATRQSAGPSTPAEQKNHRMQQHAYVGMWVTADGRIRHQLLPNGRYDEARGDRQSAYQGRYEIRGNRINYWDDTGFTADGIFISQHELHHGGMVFHRQ